MEEINVVVACAFFALLFFSSLFSFLYGLWIFYTKSNSLYVKAITYAMGCFALSHFYGFLLVIVTKELPNYFHIGNLGLVGGLMNMFTASVTKMEPFVDKENQENMKFCILSLTGPIFCFIAFLFSLLGKGSWSIKLVTSIQILFLLPAIYFNLKHLIYPDEKHGILYSVRNYNLTALFLEGSAFLILIANNLKDGVLSAAGGILLAISYVLILPVLEKGVKKWTK